MSAPSAIRVYVCDTCGYWRQERRSGVHQTTNPADPCGRMILHEMREAEYVALEEGPLVCALDALRSRLIQEDAR